MNPQPSMSVRAYARWIETAWVRHMQRPIVFSPKDWSLIHDWHARQVPLEVIDAALEESEARGRRRPRGRTRPLTYIAPAVEESWSAVVESRGARHPTAQPRADCTDVEQGWARVSERLPGDCTLRRTVASLLDRLEAGEARDVVDACLDARILDEAPPAVLDRAASVVDQALADTASEMPREVRERTRRRALVRQVRRSLGLHPLVTRA